MPVIENSSRQVFALPGLRHQTLASTADGLGHLEVWMQTLAPGAATPIYYHECEEVVVVLKGAGRLVIAGKSTDSTLMALPWSNQMQSPHKRDLQQHG